MDKINKTNPADDLFGQLKAFTGARIGIGRAGNAIPLKELLAFKMAHAHARDSVYSELNTHQLVVGLGQFKLPVLHLHSRAVNRQQYLQRPDFGRELSPDALHHFEGAAFTQTDFAIVITDGLSATAINHYAVGLIELLLPKLLAAQYKPAPISVVEQGRVAIADEIGLALNAKLSLILIGERPGLSSADSMGAYLTFAPKPGNTDEARNCISNIRKGGLEPAQAADKLFYLMTEALKLQLSGVALKDNSGLLAG